MSIVCFSVFWVSHKFFCDFAWSVLLRHLLSFWLSSLHGIDYLPVSVRFSDPTAMSTSSGVDHAVIGGVVAVIVFIMLCLLIVLGRYLIRHKGTAHSHTTPIRQRNPLLSFTHMHRSNQTQRDRAHTHTWSVWRDYNLQGLWSSSWQRAWQHPATSAAFLKKEK